MGQRLAPSLAIAFMYKVKLQFSFTAHCSTAGAGLWQIHVDYSKQNGLGASDSIITQYFSNLSCKIHNAKNGVQTDIAKGHNSTNENRHRFQIDRSTYDYGVIEKCSDNVDLSGLANEPSAIISVASHKAVIQ
ncbi:hypothetical protein KIN20_026516, partial [Parelaphostrongylus tenuis]